MDTANILDCTEREKYIILILDEVHVRENLVYNKHTGMLSFDNANVVMHM